MKSFLDWLDNRTGLRQLTHEALFENVPGGSRWRYVWGSTLTFAFCVQIITGIFLWMGYSPSSQTAWESVYYIQNEMTLGWMLRGLHHYTAQAMIILLALHLMQVLIDGAYKAPREVNFWFGMVLLLITLGLSLTGYLLPWDQKGYWATTVVTNLVSVVPVVGPSLQRLVVGGENFGHHTLTRFFALHAGVLPSLMVLLIVAHVALFRRHGLTAKEPRRGPDVAFWPDQVLKDAVACLAVLVAVLFFVLYYHGGELGAPADPSEPYSAARPEWYFLFLFQFLKYFPGTTEIWGALFIPGLVMAVFFAMPFIGRWKLGHRFNLGFSFALLAGAVLLTYLAVNADQKNIIYRNAVADAQRSSERVVELANSPTGIPPTGAANLLHDDAFIQGPRLFAQNCASCHRYGGTDGLGVIPKGPQAASDLKGFASREWLTGLLNPAQVSSPHYFGTTAFKDGKMVKFVKDDIATYSADEKAALVKVIAAVSAEARLPAQKTVDARDAPLITEGRKLIGTQISCTDCHHFQDAVSDFTAPDLAGYGSREWLTSFLTDPSQPRFYGTRNDHMPAFGKSGMLDPHAIGLIVDWLRGDWYVAAPAVAPAK